MLTTGDRFATLGDRLGARGVHGPVTGHSPAQIAHHLIHEAVEVGHVAEGLHPGIEIGAADQAGLRLRPQDSDGWVNLGVAYDENGQPTEAIAALRKAFKLQPALPEAWYDLGLVYGRQGEYAQAIPAFRESLRREPDRTDTWYALGVAYIGRGDRVHAMEVQRRLLALDTQEADKFLREEMRP